MAQIPLSRQLENPIFIYIFKNVIICTKNLDQSTKIDPTSWYLMSQGQLAHQHYWLLALRGGVNFVAASPFVCFKELPPPFYTVLSRQNWRHFKSAPSKHRPTGPPTSLVKTYLTERNFCITKPRGIYSNIFRFFSKHE